jgi:Fe-S-cluster-containing dehydrogenase component
MKKKKDTQVTRKTLVSAADMPEAKGYLLVDTKKCTGCCSCMLACSLVHEGKPNLSLSRIQVLDHPFTNFPNDIKIAVCKQCLAPQCVWVCPTGALHIDTEYNNVRRVDEQKCIGCKQCIKACPFTPSRISFDIDKEIAIKCDLCKEARYAPGEKDPVCVQVCPAAAIKFSEERPKPIGSRGYKVNLRGKGWEELGLPID